MARRSANPQIQIDSDIAMRAVLALLVAEREDRLYGNDPKHQPVKTEVLLSVAGLENSQIVPLVGKSADSVQKTVKRGRS